VVLVHVAGADASRSAGVIALGPLAGPSWAREEQALEFRPAVGEAPFRDTHGDGAAMRWLAEHAAELARAGP
jgi:hypothetical protein